MSYEKLKVKDLDSEHLGMAISINNILYQKLIDVYTQTNTAGMEVYCVEIEKGSGLRQTFTTVGDKRVEVIDQ